MDKRSSDDVERWFKEALSYSMKAERAEKFSEEALCKYGSIGVICECEPQELALTGGISLPSALMVKLLGGIASRRITDALPFGSKPTEQQIEQYLVGLFIGIGIETVYMLTFDDRGRFLSCEFVGEGTPTSSDVYPRRLVERAVMKSAKKVIVAHNHPKGMAEPSEDDMLTTHRLSEVFSNTGITLLSHYVVAAGDVYKINGSLCSHHTC